MAQNEPSEGLYVNLLCPANGELKNELIKFKGSRYILTVHEILTTLNAYPPPYGYKIWIKRSNSINVRFEPFTTSAELDWGKFNNCTIIFAQSYSQAMETLEHIRNANIASVRENLLKEQQKIWDEKKQKKEGRRRKVPRAVELRDKKIRMLAKMKKTARLKAEKEKTETKKGDENGSNPRD